MPRSVLITDLDNTLYDFAEYFEAGLRGMVGEVSREFTLSIEDVVARLRVIYARHETIEYPFAIEEIPEVLQLRGEARREFVRWALLSFWTSAIGSLNAYATVVSTLSYLRDQGVRLVAYTDAPLHEAMRRLRHLGLARLMTGVVAQHGEKRVPRSSMLLLRDLPGHARPSRSTAFVWRAAREDRKPNRALYERIAERLHCLPSQVTVIGDSVSRDLMPAVAAGYTAVWARYGERRSIGGNLISNVVPSVLPEVRAKRQDVPPAVHAVDQFADVIRYLPVQQFLPLDMPPKEANGAHVTAVPTGCAPEP